MKQLMVLVGVICMGACGLGTVGNSPAQPGDTGGIGTGTGGGPDDPRTPVGTQGPPYPIVLVHGLFGFDKMLDKIEGFPGVAAALEQDGAQVFAAKLDPLNNSTARGEQLRTFVDSVLVRTNSKKVILLGQSQGGLDARYAAWKAPTRVAAVVTIGTPHHGTALADYLLNVVDANTAQLTDAVFKLLGQPFFGEIAEGSDSWAALNQLTTEGMQVFNAQVKDQPGVQYVSISGRSGNVSAEAACARGSNPPFIAKYAAVKDSMSPMLLLTALVVRGTLLKPVPHDGVVRISESSWGTWLGCIPADHLDESGQGGPGTPEGFQPPQFYRDLVQFLRARGL